MKLVKIIVLSFVMVGSGYACRQCEAVEKEAVFLLRELKHLEFRIDGVTVRFNRLQKLYEQSLLDQLVVRRQTLFKLLDKRFQRKQ